MDAFFLISGFLITASYLRTRGPIEYFMNRVLRIYPGFAVCCLACLLVIGPLGAVSSASYFHDLPLVHTLRNILFLNKIDLMPSFLTASEPGQLNGSLWTIKIEFECYVLVAILGWCGILRRRLLPLCLLLVVAILFAPASANLHLPLAHSLSALHAHFRFFTCFLLGAVGFLYADRIPYHRNLFWGALALFAIAPFVPLIGCLLLRVALAYLVAYAAFHPRLRLAHFARKGDLSYGIYLYGWPVQLLLASFLFPAGSNPYFFAAIAIIAACACAFLSWYLVEKPCLRLKGKIAGLIKKPKIDSAAILLPPKREVIPPPNPVLQ